MKKVEISKNGNMNKFSKMMMITIFVVFSVSCFEMLLSTGMPVISISSFFPSSLAKLFALDNLLSASHDSPSPF